MIADRNTTMQVESNLRGDRVAMGIDTSAMAHVMGILTDLYSDPEAAVIREYSTNALDAQIAAGVWRPIEVTTPSHLSPFFKVRDHGIGIAVDDIHDIYSQYGASTKRGTNDQVGMLGLGCKSALTYTNQFTVTSVKNGTRVQVVVSRDDDGGGSMTVVDTSSTSDPDGTEITVPVKTGNSFEDKAKRFFANWEQGTVLLNGQDPTGHKNALTVTPEITLIPVEYAMRYREEAASEIVMGNVSYPCPKLDTHALGIAYGWRIVARVPIGAVNFTPSREALHYTPKTEATIQRVREEFKSNVQRVVQEQIDAATNHREAAILKRKWTSVMGTSVGRTLSYKGAAIPEVINFQLLHQFRPCMVERRAHKLSAHQFTESIAMDYVSEATFLYGFEETGWTPTKKKKLLQWAESAGNESRWFILVPKKFRSVWVDDSQFVDYKLVKDQKLPRNYVSNPSGRIPGSYDCYVKGEYKEGMPADDIDTTYPVYYVIGTANTGASYSRMIVQAKIEATLVCIISTREAKFVRNFPQAAKIETVVQKLHDAWWKNVTDDEKLALAMRVEFHHSRMLRAIKDPSAVKDPVLSKYVRLSKLSTDALNNQYHSFANHGAKVNPLPKAVNPFNPYPLATYESVRVSQKAAVEYINWKYQQGLDAQA